MLLDEVLCPHCLARGAPSSTRGPDGLVTCRECRGSFAPQPGGGAALPLPDHIVVCAEQGRFAIVLRGFFVTFGAAPCSLTFLLERDRFSWSEPTDLGPLRLKEALRAVPRSDIARFAWRRYGRKAEQGEHEVVTDLVLVDRARDECRAGFAFPARFTAGASIATLLQWAHEIWFDDGSVYRSPGVDAERPALSVLRRDGKVELLDPRRSQPASKRAPFTG